MFPKSIWILIRLDALSGSDLGIYHLVKITPIGPKIVTKVLWHIFINVACFSIFFSYGSFEDPQHMISLRK